MMQTENKDCDERFVDPLVSNRISPVTNNRIVEKRPRSSGFKLFLSWFKKLESSQKSIEDDDESTISGLSDGQYESDSSTSSTATVESFAFLPANVYKPYGDACQPEKYITPGPYTETYHRLIKERNRRRNLDKNLSLRKKYSLYSSGTIKPNQTTQSEEARDHLAKASVYDTFSLPTIGKQGIKQFGVNCDARKTASLSNKTTCHVKGKRKAPLPPANTETIKTCRKKRQAPAPPVVLSVNNDVIIQKITPTAEIAVGRTSNQHNFRNNSSNMPNFKCDIIPKPWFRRQSSENKVKEKHDSKRKGKHEFPEVGFFRCTRIFENRKQNDCSDEKVEKRVSCFLPNISELDREAAEILKRKKELEEQPNIINTHKDKVNKPSSARDLINKFNGITSHASKLSNNSRTDSSLLNKSPVAEIPRKLENSASCSNVEKQENSRKIDNSPKTNRMSSVFPRKTSDVDRASEKIPKSSQSSVLQYSRSPNMWLNNNCSPSFQTEVFSAIPNFKYPLNEQSNMLDVTPKPSTSNSINNNGGDEKAKLKEMLKEMKNSLTKRPKPTRNTESLNVELAQPVTKILVAHEKTETISNSLTPNKTVINTNQFKNILEKYKDKPIIELKNDEFNTKCLASFTKPEQVISRPREISKVSTSVQTNCSVKQLDSNIEIAKIIPPSNKIAIERKKRVLDNNYCKKQNELYINIANSEIMTKEATKEKQADLNLKLVLKQLEAAISDGNHVLAGKLAKDLALLKVRCSVTSANHTGLADHSTTKCIQIYIEDQFSHQGPIPLVVNENIPMRGLKEMVFAEFNIPTEVQKWIINKHLAMEDDTTLKQYNKGEFQEPLYLYVVSPENKKPTVDCKVSGAQNILNVRQEIENYQDKKENRKINVKTTASEPVDFMSGDECQIKNDKPSNSKRVGLYTTSGIMNNVNKNTWVCSGCTLVNSLLSPVCSACGVKRSSDSKTSHKFTEHYMQLINLDNSDLVPNKEIFECSICLINCVPNSGVVLRECLHTFCKECLANVIKYCEEVEIKCPYRDRNYFCDSALQEREIKALVTKIIYEKHLAKSINIAENKIKNAFHCKTSNCQGWCIFEEYVDEFLCPICKKKNCLNCQAIHDGKNCKEYQQAMSNAEEDSPSKEVQRSKQMLEDMVSRGEAMACPSCRVVLMKKWGCDWVKCSMCKTEICWVTRGPRWGPGGKGDTSAGCRCGVNGVKCHPKCNYCH